MKTKFSGILTLLLAFLVQITFAQEKTISGTVTDESGPLPGVSVVIKGTTTGTETDFDGKYTIKANTGDVLQFSFVGMTTQEKVVGSSNTINVVLVADNVLEEVVVTAQGTKREARSLGYSISKVDSEQLEQKAESDLGRVLSGKAAGVNITATNGVSGSGTNIVIRGYTSISGSNQPLFVVDGVPFDGGNNSQDAFFDNVTESSRFLDLDPNNIESINVLKGLSASVLYGEKGRNGVILITTKNGSSSAANKKFEITVASSYFLSEAVLPDYQTQYGGGFHQNFGFFFSNWGAAFTDDLSGNSSFRGIDADGTTLVEHPLGRLADRSLQAGFEDLIAGNYRYQNYNSVKNFFRTGTISSASVNVRGSAENVSYNVNYGRTEDEGFTPGNKLLRNTLGFGGNAKLNNKFSISGTMNYSNTNYETPPISASLGSGTIGSGGSVFGDVLYTPRSIDLIGLPFQAADGRSVYYRSGNDIQNPNWTVRNAKTTQDTDRLFGNVQLTYQFSDNYSLMYRVGIDTYTELNSYGQNRGGVDGDATGIYRTIAARNKIWDHSLIFNGNKNLTDDINLKFILGGTSRRDLYDQDGVESTNQLSFGTLRHFNFVNHSTVNSFSGSEIAFQSEVNTLGVYGDFTFAYKDYLYLNLSGRNDWTSTLEGANNTIFFKGASVSFIPTSIFENLQSTNGLNYLKVRVGYGESAGFPPAYSTRNTLALTSRLFVDNQGNVLSGNSVSNRLGNPNLVPELVREIELGIDTKFLNNRVGLNVSVFDKRTRDLITDQNLDPSTGFTITRINAGELKVQGVEVDLNVTPIRTDNFAWNLTGNFYADESEVLSLPEGTTQIALTPVIGGRPANYAIVGQPLGVLQGIAVRRDANGNMIVGADGNYLEDTSISIIGDPNPDWTSSLTNNIKYKNWTFNMTWQYRHGGDIFSQTAGATIGRGVAKVPLSREGTYVLPGVLQDGSPNNIEITATDVYFSNFGFGAEELLIFDGSTLRLSEASLGFNMPSKFLDKLPFGSITFTVSGSNLWYKAFNFPDAVNFDTNTLSTGVGNGQGLDFLTGPSSRRYGLSIKATF
jgi:TonB-linked SusC/RagA family outer membrane protein